MRTERVVSDVNHGARAGMDDPLPIGTRVRRIRLKQGKTLEQIGQLAGITGAHLSRLERGQRPIDSRRLADRLAGALGVTLISLFEEPSPGSDAALAAGALRIALASVSPADEPTEEPLPWDEVMGRFAELQALRPRADYVGVGLVLPDTMAALHAHSRGARRREALIGLTECYMAAQAAAANVGAHDLALLAGHQVELATARLDGPEWGGLAAWARVMGLRFVSRGRARALAQAGVDHLDEHLDDPNVAELAGMFHLAAALFSAGTGRTDDVPAHVTEATRLAERVGVGRFSDLSFSAWNVGAWCTEIAVDMGDGGRAMEIAQDQYAREENDQPPVCRRAAWLIDLGRAAAMSPKTRPVAKRAFLEAEQLAPQRLRANPWAQEVVTDLRNRARARDWELEDLAGRMGIAS